MFQEYVEVNSEREYYEELNEALVQCLELREGKLEIENGFSFGDEENIKSFDCEEEDGWIVITPTNGDTCSDVEQEKTPKDMSFSCMNKGEASSSETDAKVSEKNNEKKSKPLKENTSELRRLNSILLGEIFGLRHQIEVLKEHLVEYMDDILSSETDDEHENDSEESSD